MTRDIAIQSFVCHLKIQPLANCDFSKKVILREIKVKDNISQAIYNSAIMEHLNSTCTEQVQSENLLSQMNNSRDMKTGDIATHLLLEDVCNDFESIDVSNVKKKSFNADFEPTSSENSILQENESVDVVPQNEEPVSQELLETAIIPCATEHQVPLLLTVDSSMVSTKSDENVLDNVVIVTEENPDSASLAELADAEIITCGDNSVSLVLTNPRPIIVNAEEICLDGHLTTEPCAVVELTSENCSINNEDCQVAEVTDNSVIENVAFVVSGSGNDCENVSEVVSEEVAEVIPHCQVSPEKQKTNSLRVKNKLASFSKTSHAFGSRKNIRARRITLKMKSEWVSKLASVGFLTCPMPGCSQTYKALANFQTHYKYCTGKKNLQHCPYCDSLIFSSQHAILHHMNVEHPDKVTEYTEKFNIEAGELLPSSSEEYSIVLPKKLKNQHVSKSNKRKVVYKENMSSTPPQKRILKHKMKKIKETVMQNIQDFKKCVRFNDIVHKINSISDVTKAVVYQNATPDIKFFKSRKRRIIIPEEIVEEQKYFSDADDLSSSDALDINSSFESEILDASGRINTKSRLVLDLQRYKRYNEYLKLTRDWSSDRKTYSRSRSLDSSFNSPLTSSLELGLQDIHQLTDCTDSIEMPNNNASEDEVVRDEVVTDIPVFEDLESLSSLCVVDKNLSNARRKEGNKHIKRVAPNYFPASFSATLENLSPFPSRPTTRFRTTCYDGAAHSNERDTSTPRKITNDNPITYGLKVPAVHEPKKNFDSLFKNSHTFPINDVVKLKRKRGRPRSTETKMMKRMCKGNSSNSFAHTGPMKTKCKYYKEDGVKLPCELFLNPDTVKKKRGRPRKHPPIVEDNIFDIQNSKELTPKSRFTEIEAKPPVKECAAVTIHLKQQTFSRLGKNHFKQSVNSRMLHSFSTRSQCGKKNYYFARRRLVALNKLVSSMTNKNQQKKFLAQRYKSMLLKSKMLKMNKTEARTKTEMSLKMKAKRGRPAKQKLPNIVNQSNMLHDLTPKDITICNEKEKETNLGGNDNKSDRTHVDGENGEIPLQKATDNDQVIIPDAHPTTVLDSGFTPDSVLQTTLSSKPDVTANEENFATLNSTQNDALITRILGASDMYTEVPITEEVVTKPLSVKTDDLNSHIRTYFQNCETLNCDISCKVHEKGFEFIESSKSILSTDHNYTLKGEQSVFEIRKCVNNVPLVVEDSVVEIVEQSNVSESQSKDLNVKPFKRGRGRPKKSVMPDTSKESLNEHHRHASQSTELITHNVLDPGKTAATNEKPARVLRKSVRVNKRLSTEKVLPTAISPVNREKVQNDKPQLNTDTSTPIRRKRGRPRKNPIKLEEKLQVINNLKENLGENSFLKKCSHSRKGRPQKCVRFADLNSGIDSSESHDEVSLTNGRKKDHCEKSLIDVKHSHGYNKKLESCKTSQATDEECIASVVEGGLILPLKKRKTSNVQVRDHEIQISVSTENEKNNTDGAISKKTQVEKIVCQKPKTKNMFFQERELKRGVTLDLKTINEKSAKSFQNRTKSNATTICDKRKKDLELHEKTCLNQFTNASFKTSLKMCSKTAKNKIKNKLIQKLIKEHAKRKKKSSTRFAIQKSKTKLYKQFLKKSLSYNHINGNKKFKLGSETVEVRKKIPLDKEHAIDYMLTYSKKYEYKSLFQNLMPQAFMWKLLRGQDFIDYQPPLNDSAMIKIVHPKTKSETDWFSLKCFESAPYDASSGHTTFFTGGPVWSSAFCPTPLNIKTTQHIMIATSNVVNKCHTFQSGNESGLLQLWDLGHLDSTSSLETFTPKLKFCISHNHGVISCMDWCPSGCWDDPSKQLSNNDGFLPRLGLLAVACSDAFIRIYSIPQPNGLQLDSVVLPLFCSWPVILLRPLFGGPSKLTLKTKAVTVCWQKNNSCECVAAGYGNGMVFIWRVSTSTTILTKNADVQKTFYPFSSFDAHGTPITGLSFSPFFGNHLVTSGMDTTLKFWDIKDTSIPLFSFSKGGARCNQCSAQWCGAFVALDDGLSTIRSTAFKDCGIRQNSQRCLSNHNSCVWTCSLSEWLNIQAVADSSGEVTTSLAKSLQTEHVKSFQEKRYPVYRTEIRPLPDIKRKPTVILKESYILDEADRLARSTISDVLDVLDSLDFAVDSCLKLKEIEHVVYDLIDSVEKINQNEDVLHDVSIFVEDLIESVDKKNEKEDEENKSERISSNLQSCDKSENVLPFSDNTTSSQSNTPNVTHSNAAPPTNISQVCFLDDNFSGELNLVSNEQGEEYDNNHENETDSLSFKGSTAFNIELVKKYNLTSEVTESSLTLEISDKVDNIFDSESVPLQNIEMEDSNSDPLSSNNLSIVNLNKQFSDSMKEDNSDCTQMSNENFNCTHTNPETCECELSSRDNFDCILKSGDDYDSTQKGGVNSVCSQESRDDCDHMQQKEKDCNGIQEGEDNCDFFTKSKDKNVHKQISADNFDSASRESFLSTISSDSDSILYGNSMCPNSENSESLNWEHSYNLTSNNTCRINRDTVVIVNGENSDMNKDNPSSVSICIEIFSDNSSFNQNNFVVSNSADMLPCSSRLQSFVVQSDEPENTAPSNSECVPTQQPTCDSDVKTERIYELSEDFSDSECADPDVCTDPDCTCKDMSCDNDEDTVSESSFYHSQVKSVDVGTDPECVQNVIETEKIYVKNSNESTKSNPGNILSNHLSKYEYLSENLGIVFNEFDLRDIHNIEESELQRLLETEKMSSLPDDYYKLSSINTVCWNPNYGSHFWLFTAGQSGIAHLSCASGLEKATDRKKMSEL